ncbi:MAG: MgtC/SapB family protein [Candidatus Aenigmarchaeota archaeon]|nr:MgtC/SapB family protein [Candidatus Aenigmarchaeota archaeon]
MSCPPTLAVQQGNRDPPQQDLDTPRFIRTRAHKKIMAVNLLSGYEVQFLAGLVVSVIAGFAIGVERETRGKAAGISTHCFVIGGSFLFTLLSTIIDPLSPARIAAQIVSGIGFLGAGIILQQRDGEIRNLTTAANIWFSAAIGMAIGFEWYLIALGATAYAVVVPRIPHIRSKDRHHDR